MRHGICSTTDDLACLFLLSAGHTASRFVFHLTKLFSSLSDKNKDMLYDMRASLPVLTPAGGTTLRSMVSFTKPSSSPTYAKRDMLHDMRPSVTLFRFGRPHNSLFCVFLY